MTESSPSSVHIFGVHPYNHFTVTCNASTEVEGETVPLEMTVDWVRRAGPDSFSNVPYTDYVTTGSPEDGYQSTLTTTETETRKEIYYRCRARLVVDSSIQGIRDTALTVEGKVISFIFMCVSACC